MALNDATTFLVLKFFPPVNKCFCLFQLNESIERARQEQESANKAKKQLNDVQQRLLLSEQSYLDLSAKYSDMQSAKYTVEKDLRELKLALENETLSRNQVSEQSAELHGG